MHLLPRAALSPCAQIVEIFIDAGFRCNLDQALGLIHFAFGEGVVPRTRCERPVGWVQTQWEQKSASGKAAPRLQFPRAAWPPMPG